MTSRLTCLIWGHAVDNRVFVAEGRACTRCGTTLLRDDPAPVRIGHTLSCFLSHHTYEPVDARDGHMEYGCVRCGHPLLFPLDADPYSERHRFQKRVRYACGLFGHHVHRVGERNGGVGSTLRVMCRNITELRGLEPPATREEIEAAARQFVRKVSGVTKPKGDVAAAMEDAALEIAHITEHLLAEVPQRRQPPKTDPPLRRPEVRKRLGLPEFVG